MVDGTGLGWCPMADFGISGVEILGSVTRKLVKYGNFQSNFNFT
jgi:hypothetical protein